MNTTAQTLETLARAIAEGRVTTEIERALGREIGDPVLAFDIATTMAAMQRLMDRVRLICEARDAARFPSPARLIICDRRSTPNDRYSLPEDGTVTITFWETNDIFVVSVGTTNAEAIHPETKP